MSFFYRRSQFFKFVFPLAMVLFGIYFLGYLSLDRWGRKLEQELETSTRQLAEKGFGSTEEEIVLTLDHLRHEIDVLKGIAEGDRRSLENDPLISDRIQAEFQNFEFEHERQNVINRLASQAGSSGIVLQSEIWDSFPIPESAEALDRPHLIWAQLALTNQVLSSALKSRVDAVQSIQLIPPYSIVESQSGTRIVEEVRMAIRVRGSMESLRLFFLQLVMNRVQLEAAGLEAGYEGKGNLYIDRFILEKKSVDKAEHVLAEMIVSSFVKVD